MKAQWEKFSARVDALSLRERIAVFVAAVALAIYLLHLAVFDPMFARNKLLNDQIRQQHHQTEAFNAEIRVRMAAFEANPDAPAQKALADLKQQAAQLAETLRTRQRGLVAPDKMSALLQQMLRANGRLKLMSLRTLPVTGMGAPDAEAPAGKTAPAQAPLLYRHGVEIVVQGSYLDMLAYMETLQALPTQLFWGQVQLDAAGYPVSTLTLTLYTLSLDEKWMTL